MMTKNMTGVKKILTDHYVKFEKIIPIIKTILIINYSVLSLSNFVYYYTVFITTLS